MTLVLNSCNEKVESNKYDKNGNLIVYNQEVYAKMWFKNRNLKVTVIDTFCINQKKRAIQDIKKGKLIYFGSDILEFKKLTLLLEKYGIQTKDFSRSCVRLGGFQPYCYQDEMRKEIDKRYGENFIDSLSEVAKKQYIMENPHLKYMEDGKDLREKYLAK